jgi:Flp pilus assembly pilin Flp
MRDPAGRSISGDPAANAAKYALIVAVLSVAIVTVVLGIGPSLTAALGHLAGR